MDPTSGITSALLLSSIIVSGALSINFTENYGSLVHSGKVQFELNGNQILGIYGNAMVGISYTIIVLSAILLLITIFSFIQRKGRKNVVLNKRKTGMISVTTIAILVGIAQASFTLFYTDNFNNIHKTYDPSIPISGQNYKLRGILGNTVLGLSISSIALSVISMGIIGWFWSNTKVLSGLSTKKIDSFFFK